MDKTGTLTLGRPAVAEVVPAPGFDVSRVLDLAASLEQGSEHPLGEAIVRKARETELGFGKASSFEAIVGRGVSGDLDGARVLVGSRRLLAERGVDTSLLERAAADQQANGATVVFAAVDGAAAGVIAISDPVKAEAAEAVRGLRGTGLDVWLLTGDARVTAEAVARAVGIPADRVIAEVLPGEKDAVIERLQGEGHKVAMVGDGINDAPALARADLGVAIGTGADVAIEASDVTLVGGDPRLVGSAIALSKWTLRVIRQNLFWAFAYNVLLIPIAMGALYPAFGVTINPALAAGAMALSSVSVVSNSLRLRRVDVRPGQLTPMRRGTLGLVRDGAYLLAIGLIGLAVAGGVLAADQAVDAALPTVSVANTMTVKAGQLTVIELANTSGSVQAWMADGLANVELLTRPGQTSRIRVAISQPGIYMTSLGSPDWIGAAMGTLVVTP